MLRSIRTQLPHFRPENKVLSSAGSGRGLAVPVGEGLEVPLDGPFFSVVFVSTGLVSRLAEEPLGAAAAAGPGLSGAGGKVASSAVDAGDGAGCRLLANQAPAISATATPPMM